MFLYSNKHMKESTVNFIQLYNLAKLRKIKNKYTIQFLKVESPPRSLFWQVTPYAPLNMPPQIQITLPFAKLCYAFEEKLFSSTTIIL